jgi:hypothetical protein
MASCRLQQPAVLLNLEMGQAQGPGPRVGSPQESGENRSWKGKEGSKAGCLGEGSKF